MSLVDPEGIAFGSIDDGLAEDVARSMGWRGHTEKREQEPVHLPTFGPRKIHSTREIEPDPLLDFATQYPPMPPLARDIFSASIIINGVRVTIPMGGTVIAAGMQITLTSGNGWYRLNYSPVPIPLTAPVWHAPPPSKKPQWSRPFYENRPTEPAKIGRPKRRRK